MANKNIPYTITITGITMGTPLAKDYVVQKTLGACRDMPGVLHVVKDNTPAKPKRAPKSRPERWHAAVSALRAAHDAIEAAAADYDAALDDLQSVKDEYQEWFDNMPEGLQQGATGEKLSAICDLDLDTKAADTITDLTSAIDELEAADLPAGFGRD